MYKNLGRMKRVIEEYMLLTIATLILVAGVYVFKFPNNFSFGGVTGLAIVLSQLLPFTPNGYLYYQYGIAGTGISIPGKRFRVENRLCQRIDVGGSEPC